MEARSRLFARDDAEWGYEGPLGAHTGPEADCRNMSSGYRYWHRRRRLDTSFVEAEACSGHNPIQG